jgi:AmmeMemoRadiSam system protein A
VPSVAQKFGDLTGSENLSETEQRRALLGLAREAIQTSLVTGERPSFPERAFPQILSRPGASIVTLRLGRDLRGSAGSFTVGRPLCVDVWHNAWRAAFSDPRFAPLRASEWKSVNLKLSLLTPSRRVRAWSEARLVKKLRPKIDGLTLEYQGSRATFPPSVWEQIPDPKDFVAFLKLKAGLPAGFWSREIRIERYFATQCAEVEY